jgi:hypothetical protein
MQKTINFDDFLVNTIKEVLENVFDKNTALTLLQYTLLHYIGENDKEKLDTQVQCFSDSLHKILGNGATIVEDLILENLFSKLNMELKWRKDYTFSDQVRFLRKEAGIQCQLGQ